MLFDYVCPYIEMLSCSLQYLKLHTYFAVCTKKCLELQQTIQVFAASKVPTKLIIEKSRNEVSLMEQDTIENVS